VSHVVKKYAAIVMKIIYAHYALRWENITSRPNGNGIGDGLDYVVVSYIIVKLYGLFIRSHDFFDISNPGTRCFDTESKCIVQSMSSIV